MSTAVHFRAGVGILVRDPKGAVLALERADRPGSWQAPQGGIEPGETPLAAAKRELAEETGIRWRDVVLVEEYPTWLSYELPADARSAKTGIGQTQRWFLVDYDGPLSTRDLVAGGEFTAARWVSMHALVEELWAPRRTVYEQLRERWFTEPGLD